MCKQALHVAAAPISQPSVTDELTNRAKLKEQGLVIETEFAAKKKQLLGL
jgi:hypothetical protein